MKIPSGAIVWMAAALVTAACMGADGAEPVEMALSGEWDFTYTVSSALERTIGPT